MRVLRLSATRASRGYDESLRQQVKRLAASHFPNAPEVEVHFYNGEPYVEAWNADHSSAGIYRVKGLEL